MPRLLGGLHPSIHPSIHQFINQRIPCLDLLGGLQRQTRLATCKLLTIKERRGSERQGWGGAQQRQLYEDLQRDEDQRVTDERLVVAPTRVQAEGTEPARIPSGRRGVIRRVVID